MFNLYTLPDDIFRLFISLLLGVVIGLEREYRGKPAGVRTITLISFGSCLFTLISQKLSADSPDRVAANIVTGVGFIGGGVIFKEGFSVSGLTTAATIWLSAAFGMAAGSNNYLIAFVGLGLAIIILSTFEYLREFVEFFRESRKYKIHFPITKMSVLDIDEQILTHKLKFKKHKITRKGHIVELVYEIYASERKLEQFDVWLNENPNIQSYDY